MLFCILIIFFGCASNSKRQLNNKNRAQIQFHAYPQLNEMNYGIQVNLYLPNSIFVFQKIDNQFIANYQLSIAILDSAVQQIGHHSWQENKTVSYFEDTKSIKNAITTGYFFETIPGKYSISILIEDLDSKYRWHKEIQLKEYKSEFISPNPAIKTSRATAVILSGVTGMF